MSNRILQNTWRFLRRASNRVLPTRLQSPLTPALFESKAILRVLFDESFELAGLLTPDGTVLKINRRAAEMVNNTPNKIIGQKFWDTPWWTHSPDQQEQLKHAIIRAAQGEFVRFEANHISPEGRVLYVDFSLKPVRNRKGTVILLIPEGRDITDRKQTELALRASEARTRAIIENEPECVKVLGLDGELQDMNPAGLAMLEAESVAQVRDRSILAFIEPEYRKAFTGLHDRVMKGESGTLEFQARGLKGNIRWLETHAVPLRNSSGSIYAVLGITRDITARKRSEEIQSERNSLEKQIATIASTAPGALCSFRHPSGWTRMFPVRQSDMGGILSGIAGCRARGCYTGICTHSPEGHSSCPGNHSSLIRAARTLAR